MSDPTPASPTPAWRRASEGESRWLAGVAILVAIGLQLPLPPRLAFHPRWLLPALEALMLVGLVVANPDRISRRSGGMRIASLVLTGLLSLGNAWSAGRLVHAILRGTVGNATQLLGSGSAVWLTNVIAFALWYWELDRGGPGARAEGVRVHPDLLFPQMASPELAPDHWEPNFVDYFYVSFTNATAFSPTDTMPMTHWAKLAMLVQSGVSLVTVGLVVARAVNVLH